ncbi:MAG: hypothetical protein JXO72_08460 [Vicinamibacteria bacterium]|nr:hypothetical protein [Vicinamibacteria bacterium]
MKMSRPAFGTWLVAVVLGAAGILMRFGVLHVTGLGIDPFWFVTIAFCLLALGCFVKRL